MYEILPEIKSGPARQSIIRTRVHNSAELSSHASVFRVQTED